MLHSAPLPRASLTMRHTLLILILVVLTGCGSKGALFLPKDEAADAQPASAQPASGQSEPAEAIDAQTIELPPSDELPAEEQATPQGTDDDTISEPVWEEEDDEDINL